MKYNSILIALTILAASFILRPPSIFDTLTELQEAGKTNKETGTSLLEDSFSKLSSAMSQGLTYSVMNSYEENQIKKDMKIIAGLNKFKITQVKLMKGEQKHKEIIIGMIKNLNDFPVKNIQLNIVLLNKAGDLNGVIQGYQSQIKGIIEPQQTLGFKFERSLGNYNEKKEELAKNLSDSFDISVVDYNIIQLEETPQ